MVIPGTVYLFSKILIGVIRSNGYNVPGIETLND